MAPVNARLTSTATCPRGQKRKKGIAMYHALVLTDCCADVVIEAWRFKFDGPPHGCAAPTATPATIAVRRTAVDRKNRVALLIKVLLVTATCRNTSRLGRGGADSEGRRSLSTLRPNTVVGRLGLDPSTLRLGQWGPSVRAPLNRLFTAQTTCLTGVRPRFAHISGG